MAITTPSEHLNNDSRYKSWAKLIRGPQDVDLGAKNGYSLTGPWVRWTESVALEPGQYLVCAAETGSRKNHTYDYALRTVDQAGEVINGEKDRYTAEEWVARCAWATEEQRARAKNSTLYSYALTASWEFAGRPGLVAVDRVDHDALALVAEAAKLRARLEEIKGILAQMAGYTCPDCGSDCAGECTTTNHDQASY